MNEEKYIIELNHPYRNSGVEPHSIAYVERAILDTDDQYLELLLSFERKRAVPLSNRKIIRRTLNKIISVFINQNGIRRQPRPRVIRIA